MPRNGWYSLDAQFRTIGDDSWHHIDTTIALDGFVVFQEELHRTSLGLKGRAFSFRDRFLKKGSRLAFTVGPGWFDDKNYGGWQNSSDATALTVKIVERNYDQLPELEADVADLGSTLLAATTETAAGGRITDASGIGTWEIYDTKAKDKSLDMGGKRAMSEVMPSAVGERGVRFESARSSEGLPYLQVCGLTQVGTLRGESADAQSADRYWPIDAVAPGEVLVGNYYPAAEGGHVGVRFVPNESGVYTVLLKARDVCYGQYSDGVEVSVWVAGVQSVRQLVSVEQSDATKTWMHYQTDPVFLSANMPVDVVISPRDWHACDETGLGIEIIRLPKVLNRVGVDAFVALEDMAKASPIANPFVSQGATWQLGALSGDGTFELLNTSVSYDNGTVGFSAADEYPRVLANVNQTARGISTGGYFYPGEFLMHPSIVKYSVVRYLAPSSGVYAVRARFRDVDRMDWGEGTESMTGVRCYLMANGIYAAGGEASCDGHTNVSSDNVLLTADRVYRAEGEPIDIVVDSRDYHPECDSTAVRAFIEPMAALTVASVDFNAPGSSVHSGLGRVGYDGGVWKSLAARDGANGASCRYLLDDHGGRVGVSVEVRAPAGGCMMATGAGHPLMSDGFAARGSADPYLWTVRGLVAGEAYSFYLYGTSSAVFAVNGTDYSPDSPAFNRLEKNVVVVRAIADSDGKVTGSFGGEAGSLFCGMQIEGPRFDPYVPTGLSIMVR